VKQQINAAIYPPVNALLILYLSSPDKLPLVDAAGISSLQVNQKLNWLKLEP